MLRLLFLGALVAVYGQTPSPTKQGFCAPNCPPYYLGDSYCDPACNNAACSFDCNANGVCDCQGGQTPLNMGTAPPTVVPTESPTVQPTLAPSAPPTSGVRCDPNCPTHWVGDGYCDSACNVAACKNDCSQHRCDCNASGKVPSTTPTMWPTPSPTRRLSITPGLFASTSTLEKRSDVFPSWSKNPSFHQLDCSGDSFNLALVKGMAWCKGEPQCAHFAVYKTDYANRKVHFYKSDDNLGGDVNWDFYSRAANITSGYGLIGGGNLINAAAGALSGLRNRNRTAGGGLGSNLGNGQILGNLRNRTGPLFHGAGGRLRSLFQTKPPNWTPSPTMPDVCNKLKKKFECQLFNCEWTPMLRTCNRASSTPTPTSANQGQICAAFTLKFMCNRNPGCSWIPSQSVCVAGTPTQAPTRKGEVKCWEVNKDYANDAILRKSACDQKAGCVWSMNRLKCFADKSLAGPKCQDIKTETDCAARTDCLVVSRRNNPFVRCKKQ